MLPTYSHRGPKKKCRCGLQLVADDDECDKCQRNDQVFAILEVLPPEELTPAPTTLVRKLDQSQQQQLDRLLENNKGLFYREGDLLPQTDVVEHCIDTGDATPIKQWFYRTSQVEQTFIENEIRRMLVDGLIREAQDPWASPVVLQPDPPSRSKS